MELQKVYVVTMWSGGKPSRKWKSLEQPELLPQGTGLSFTSLDTKLKVHVIGSLSVEEFEQGDPATWFPDAPPPGAQGGKTKNEKRSADGPDLTVL